MCIKVHTNYRLTTVRPPLKSFLVFWDELMLEWHKKSVKIHHNCMNRIIRLNCSDLHTNHFSALKYFKYNF